MRGCEFRSGGRGGLRPSCGRRREAFVASGVAMKGSIRAPCRPEQGRRAWDGRAGSGEQKAWDSTAALAREGGSRQARPSYAAVVAAGRVPRSIFPDLAIPPRRVQRRDGNPLVLFSEDEVRPAYSDMANAVILKFAQSRPSVAAVTEYLRRRELKHIPVIGALDGRHCLVICRSEGDAVEVLTSDSNRIGDLSFRTFRWLPGFTTKAEPTIMVSWVRLKGLDPCFFRTGFLKEVCRGFGRFLRADPDTLNLINPGVARVCVEVDVRCPLARGMWVGTERRQNWIDIEYEGRVDYCCRCRKQGHSIECCRREIARHHRAENMKGERNSVRKEVSSNGCSVSVRFAGAAKGASEEGQWHAQRRKIRRKGVLKVSQVWRKKATGLSSAAESAANLPMKSMLHSVESGRVVKERVPAARFSMDSGPFPAPSDCGGGISALGGRSSGVIVAEEGAQRDLAGVVVRSAEKGSGGEVAASSNAGCSAHTQQMVRCSSPGMEGTPQPVGRRVFEPSSLRMAIESSFMRRIRSSIEDYVCQVYGDSLPEALPTSYRRSLSVDDSEVPIQSVLALPWEEYRSHSISVMPEDPVDIENVNREISAHIISLQKARDSTRRVTRSALKSVSDHIINDA